MDAAKFVSKWRQVELTERSACQQHFLDLCDLVGHSKPAEMDHKGEFFTFERGVTKRTGGMGWADVWKRDFFAIEYKGKHKNLDDAYDQLLLYRGSLENPPLLVVCDMDRIIIRTNFNKAIERIHTISLDDLALPKNLDILAWLDSTAVDRINPDLTTGPDVTTARRLKENLAITFMGDTKGGNFDIKKADAVTHLRSPNPGGKPTSDVITGCE